MSDWREGESMDLGAVLRALRRRLGWVLLCAILAAGAASIYSLLQDEKYTATASLLPQPASTNQPLGSPSSAPERTPERQAATDLELAGRDIVPRRTRRDLQRRGDIAAANAVSDVEVRGRGESDLIEVKATAGTALVAAQVANAFAAEYVTFRRDADRASIQQSRRLVARELRRLVSERRSETRPRGIRSLNRRISTLERQAEDLKIQASLQTGNATIVDRAAPPASPSSPKPVRNTILGGLAGLLLGLGMALVREKTDRRLRDPRELEEAFGLPVLARLPDSDALGKRLGIGHDLPPFEAEAFRMLRANLRYFESERNIDSVLVTSAAAQDGKSTVAFNLAAAAAAARLDVLLVEAEVRRPTLARSLGLPPEEGLLSVLAGEMPIAQACHEVLLLHDGDPTGLAPTMDVLLAGEWRSDASELVESERMRELLREWRGQYSLVVIDTPPAGLVSNAISLMSDVSAVLVVGRIGKLTHEQAGRLRDQLEQIDAPTFGIVANFTDPHDESYDLAGYELAGSRPSR